jgi:hypothetical protein
MFDVSRAGPMVTQAREQLDRALHGTAPPGERTGLLNQAGQAMREVTLALRNKGSGRGLVLATEAVETAAAISYAEAGLDIALVTLMGAAEMNMGRREKQPSEPLARIAGTASLWFARMGCVPEAANFAVEHLNRLADPQADVVGLARASALAAGSGRPEALALFAEKHPATQYVEPLSGLLSILAHQAGSTSGPPRALLGHLQSARGADLDLEFHCGIYVLGECLAAGAYDTAHRTVAYLRDRTAGSAEGYLLHARLSQASAAAYAGEQRWAECLPVALRAWSIFDEVRYRSGAPFVRAAIQALSRRSRHCALRAAVGLGDRRTLLELIEASRLQSTVDMVGSAAEVDAALANQPVVAQARAGTARSIDPDRLVFPYEWAFRLVHTSRSTLAAPVDIQVHGESVLAQGRADAVAGLLFEPLGRDAIEATEAVRRVASGPYQWWSSWYEEGSHFSAVVRDGEPVAAVECRVAEDADLRDALTIVIAGYAMPLPWMAPDDTDVDVGNLLADCGSFAEATFTGTLSRLLPAELCDDAAGRPLLMSVAPEFVGVPWPILPIAGGTGVERRLVEVHELRFLPSLTALAYGRPATSPEATPVPFLLSCDYLPGADGPATVRPAAHTFGPGGQPPTAENVVRVLRTVSPGASGLAFFRSHYATEDGDPSSSGVVLSNGILPAGLLGAVDERAGSLVPVPSRVILSACASTGVQGRGGGEALGMAAMCLKAGAQRVIATSVRIEQSPFTDALDDMLIYIGLTAENHFPALRELHLRLLSEWRVFSLRGGLSDPELSCRSPTPHIWAHYQPLGYE